MSPNAAGQHGSDLDVLRIDKQLSPEEILVRDAVRAFTAERVMPHIADWFEAGIMPREIAPELGKLGLLGMHLTGYGTAEMGAVAYGVACRELEAADSDCAASSRSRARWPCSRSGSTARPSRKTSGCPGWRRARRSAASG